MTSALTLTGELPPTPLVLLAGDTVARVQSLTADAAAVTALNTPAEANHAGQLLREIAGLNRDIEKARVEVVAPFLDFQRRINAAAKTEQAKLEAAERSIRNRLSFYQIEQEKKAREEAERLRKEQERLAAEAARLARERAAAEEAARKAAEAPAEEEDDGLGALAAEAEADSLAQEQARVATAATQLAQTRAVVAPKPAGIHYRTTLKHQVTDVTRLPSNLVIVTPNDAEIRRLFVTGWKEGDALPTVPGITFTIDKQAVVTGRR